MSRRLLAAFVLSTAFTFICQSSFAADPTLHQVYQAAEAGNYREAQSLMDQVLKDHPNSAKAHFVEAELLAKQGKTASAKTELKAAEQLDPSFQFTKPGALQELRTRLSAVPAGATGSVVERIPQPVSGFPWGLLVVGLMLVATIVFFLRRRPSPVTVFPASAGAVT